MAKTFDIAPTTAFWFVVVGLAACSLFFVANVEMRRLAWGVKEKAFQLESGAVVSVLKVIDGDEISVKHGETVFMIRLLGIKCFDSKVIQHGISELGAACESALARRVLDKEVEVEFNEFKKDRVGRLLAYVSRNGQDVGRALVEQGFALVYSRYAFDREDIYRAFELAAESRARGIWGNDRARQRAKLLKAEWRAQREAQTDG